MSCDFIFIYFLLGFCVTMEIFLGLGFISTRLRYFAVFPFSPVFMCLYVSLEFVLVVCSFAFSLYRFLLSS